VRRPALTMCGALAVALVCGAASQSLAAMQTTRTTYQYNADHALTAVTTTVDGQSSTVYFTWDNCVVSTGDPTSCTLSAGNGNLLGIGSTPGSNYTTQFTFDQRNRLTSATPSGAETVSYTYHPASLMATAAIGNTDSLAFTYDVSSLPQVANIQQSSTGKWASYLEDTTYVSDGTEQVLCSPRKDVAGVFEPAAGSFTPLRYDPYGSVESASSATSTPATGATSYDLTENPFQYTGEYTDPSWGGVYLRARWYLARYDTFLGRDPADPIHHYGYAGGNPLGNVDPSGLTYGSVSRAIEKAFRPLTSGTWGYIVPLVPVLGQVVGGATLLASVPQLWHHGSEATWINFGFLGVSAAAEGLGALRSFDAAYGSKGAFALRHAIDLAVGVGQTALVDTLTRKGRKLDVPALIQSAEYSVGTILTAREIGGIGYRPDRVTAADIERATTAGEVNLYKVQLPLGKIPMGTSPLLESFNLGLYHEGLVAIGTDARVGHEGEQYLRLHEFAGQRGLKSTWDLNNVNTIADAKHTTVDRLKFEYIGTFDQEAVNDKFLQGMSESQRRLNVEHWYTRQGHYYNLFMNNCQDFTDEIISSLRARGAQIR